jgi:hypothetical protein
MEVDTNEILNSVRIKLRKQNLRPGQVASLGNSIFRLKNVYKKLNDKEYQSFLNEFMQLVEKWDLHDLLERQIRYAIRLAGDEGELIYEEMFKLFCLCDEIVGLKGLGFEVDESLNNELKDALSHRFKREPKNAKLVAEDLYEDWKKDYWWYSENLKIPKKQE